MACWHTWFPDIHPPSCFLYTIPNTTLFTLLKPILYTVLYTPFYTVLYTTFYTVLFAVLYTRVYTNIKVTCWYGLIREEQLLSCLYDFCWRLYSLIYCTLYFILYCKMLFKLCCKTYCTLYFQSLMWKEIKADGIFFQEIYSPCLLFNVLTFYCTM